MRRMTKIKTIKIKQAIRRTRTRTKMRIRKRINPLREALPRARAKLAPSRVRKLRRLSDQALQRSQSQVETSPRGRRSRRLSSRPLEAELERRLCNSRPSSARPRLAVLVLAVMEKLPLARCRMAPAPRRRSRWSLEVRELVPPPPEPAVLPGPAAPQEVRWMFGTVRENRC